MERLQTIEDTTLDNVQQLEPKKSELPAFPEEAITGLFKKYLDLVGPSTEAPDSYHWVVFLTVAGLLFGRKLFINQPMSLYPNFYSLLIGQTGLSRKSTAMRLGIEDVL